MSVHKWYYVAYYAIIFLMFYDHWVADAEALVGQLPSSEFARTRSDYLLHGLGVTAVVGNTPDLRSFYWTLPDSIQSGDRFFIVAEAPSPEDIDMTSPLAGIATGQTIEAVVKQDGLRVMILPKHDPAKKNGNGLVILHVMQHIAEPYEGFPGPDITDPVENLGMCEIRAYGLNEAVITAIDGSDYEKYVKDLSIDVSITPLNNGAYRYQTIGVPGSMRVRPPKDTFMDTCWGEGGLSRGILHSTAVTRTILDQTIGSPVAKSRRLVAHMLNGES